MDKREADFDHLKEGLPVQVQEREIDINPELPLEAKPEEKIAPKPEAQTEQEAVEASPVLDDNSADARMMKELQADYDALKAQYEAMIEKMKEESDRGMKEDRMMKEEERVMDKEEERMMDEKAMMEYMKDFMKGYMKEFMKEFAGHLPEEKMSTLQNEQNTEQKLDKLTNLNNSNSDNNIPKGEDMSPEDIAKIVTQVTRSILSEQNKVEETKTEDRKTEDRTKLEAAYGASEPSMEELKARLERAEDTLNRVLEMPLRKGRHTSTQVRGIGSETQMDHMIQSVEQEGHQALASVFKRYRNHIMRSADKVVNPSETLNSHELKDVLAKGLRAAFLDGLIGTPVDGWQ